MVTRGRISKENIEKVLGDKLKNADALCSDSHRSYTAFAKTLNVDHKKFNSSKGQRIVDKFYHVQNVNNMDKRMRAFMSKFNGVATKYLQNYLNWFLVLEKLKAKTNKMTTLMAIALTSDTSWFKEKQILFNMFIRT